MASLAGLGVGGAVGEVTGALVGMGIPEFEAKRYEGRLQEGGILLSVHCDTSEEIKRGKEVIERTGGEDVSSTGESSVDARKNRKWSLPKGRARDSLTPAEEVYPRLPPFRKAGNQSKC